MPDPVLFPYRVQLGGKGANLCEMAKCGVNVPPGMTITTEVCQEFYKVGKYHQSSKVDLLVVPSGVMFGGLDMLNVCLVASCLYRTATHWCLYLFILFCSDSSDMRTAANSVQVSRTNIQPCMAVLVMLTFD